MKTKLLQTLCGALLAGTLVLGGSAFAQGNGGGGGGPGGGGGGGDATPPDYGDLIILYRDEWGKPFVDANMCQQPIGFPDPDLCPAEGLIWNDTDDVWLVPTDPNTCAIDTAHAACTDEADFGRTNTARSSDEVLESQLEDVIIGLAIADCTTLDPAGRMVHSRYVDELVTTTVDSPLQNLAVYKQLMREGSIGVPLPEGATAIETAARGLGVAMDKSGKVNIDLIVYLNEILGLTEGATILGDVPICIDVKEEVMGSIELVQKCFLDYSGYTYRRQDNFGLLPSPPYIPAGNPTLGMFESLRKIADNTYEVAERPILQTVFPDGNFGFEPGFTAGNIGGFAQAADDTRAVINFMHNWPVPADGETAIPCTAIPDPTLKYDLSISDQSGLKVPKQVVASTEGREFTVSVANAGPDLASGTIFVTAVRDDGGDVLVEGFEPGLFDFEFEGLKPGLSFTTEPVVFTLGLPHGRTKITWTATVEPGDVDPYMGNNTVTETSNVR